MKSIQILFASVLFLSACTSAAPVTPAATVDPFQSTMPALTDPSQPIVVNAGDTFPVVVESNPSTGYHWETIDALDKVHLELISREYTASEPVLAGSGGVEVWILKAVAPGEAVLALGSYPPGEGTSYEQEVRFSVTIQ